MEPNKSKYLNTVAPPQIYDQAVFNSMELPVNDDYLAVGLAVGELLREKWQWEGLYKQEDGKFYIRLTRQWKC